MEDQELEQSSVKNKLRNVMNDLLLLQAYIDAIESLSQDMVDKSGCAVLVLAAEGSKLCSKAHTEVDCIELDIGKSKQVEV